MIRTRAPEERSRGDRLSVLIKAVAGGGSKGMRKVDMARTSPRLTSCRGCG
jgi:biotin carboxylase